ncbi:MAG: ABC transporter permease, partial [Chloroflexota bacterium]|nr:ABC transporter permease [Chloroflexota bacterium]
GDPAYAMLGERATPNDVQRIHHQLGLDRPLALQYFEYLGRLFHGDLGTSIVTNQPVAGEIARRFPATVELTIGAMVVALLIGLPAGIISATKPYSAFDGASMVLSLAGVSMPVFWLGLMLIYFVAVLLRWLPPGGRLDLGVQVQPITHLLVLDSIITANGAGLVSALRHLALPAMTLGTIPMAIVARMTRSAMLEVLGQDYVRTGRSKGLRETVIVGRHVLKNALLPVVTVIGLQVGLLLTGAILTETIFSWPGIGFYVYSAILAKDFPVIQSGILFFAAIFILANLLVDLSYAVLDPRIRYA